MLTCAFIFFSSISFGFSQQQVQLTSDGAYLPPQLIVPNGPVFQQIPLNGGCIPTDGECIKNLINAYLPSVLRTCSRLALPSINPLQLNSLFVPKGNGVVKVDLQLYNVRICGLENFQITDIQVDLGNLKVVLKLQIPEIVVKAQYDAFGRIFVIPLYGNGPATIVLENAVVVLELGIFSLGTEIAPTSLCLSVSPSLVRYDFQNLIPNEPILGVLYNELLNVLWPEIFNEAIVPFQDALSPVLLDILNSCQIPTGIIQYNPQSL